MVWRILNGTFMRISIRRFCDRRRCGSSWSALKCWACRSGTLRRRTLLRGCVRVRKRTSRDFKVAFWLFSDHASVDELVLVGASCACSLHFVHGAVGGFEQGIHFCSILRKASMADAGGQVERIALEAKRLVGFLRNAIDN